MGNQPEVLQGAQISSKENEIGHPYVMHWDAEMMEVVKWEEFASKIKFTLPNYWTQAALNWGLAWNRKNCKKSIKIYCKMLSWQTSLFWSSKALVQQNPLSCPGGQASDRTGALQTREQCQAARGLYLLLHHFPLGWRRGPDAAKISDQAFRIEMSWIRLSRVTLAEGAQSCPEDGGTCRWPPAQAGGPRYAPQRVTYL